MTDQLPMTAVVALAIEPAWLALPRDQRRAKADIAFRIVEEHPAVQVRWFDADALSGRHTDFAICSFTDIKAYHFLWEALRDTELFSHPYMRIVDVMLGIERGYEVYEQRLEH